MKSGIWLSLAFVVGLTVDSWGPRTDLRLLRERVEEERTVRKGGRGTDPSEYVRVNMSLVVGMSSREVLTPGKRMLMTFVAVDW